MKLKCRKQGGSALPSVHVTLSGAKPLDPWPFSLPCFKELSPQKAMFSSGMSLASPGCSMARRAGREPTAALLLLLPISLSCAGF